MAQSVNDIQNQILTAITANVNLQALTSPSQTAYYRLWTFISAVNYQIEQQMWDETQVQLQQLLFQNAPGTPQWLANQVLQYQYGYVVQLNSNYQPYYPIIDTGATIVTQVAVNTDASNNVLVKVATGSIGALSPLTQDQLDGLTSYIDAISFCGVNVITTTADADRLYVPATIYYNGQYLSGTVLTNVVSAITEYCYGIPFDGKIFLSQLETAILAVAGVEDLTFGSVSARQATNPYGTEQVPVTRTYLTTAGYIIPEDTASFTLNDSLFMQLDTD